MDIWLSRTPFEPVVSLKSACQTTNWVCTSCMRGLQIVQHVWLRLRLPWSKRGGTASFGTTVRPLPMTVREGMAAACKCDVPQAMSPCWVQLPHLPLHPQQLAWWLQLTKLCMWVTKDALACGNGWDTRTQWWRQLLSITLRVLRLRPGQPVAAVFGQSSLHSVVTQKNAAQGQKKLEEHLWVVRVPLDGRIGRTLSLGSTSVLHGVGGILMGHDPFSSEASDFSGWLLHVLMLAV